MIYLDTSVALAHLLAEDRYPPADLWDQTIVSSRLLEYELWNRLHARRLGTSHRDAAQALLGRVAFLDLIPEVIGRARDPFPVELRTLDTLHLASLQFLREQPADVVLATYDQRMLSAARRLKLPTFSLP